MTKQPSYRFAGYTEVWEEKKLSDGISKIGDGIHGTPVYSEDGDYYFINGNNLVDGKIFLFPETKKVQSNQLTVSDTSLKKNTILMSINGTIGSLAWYRDEKIMLGKSVAYLTTEEFDRKFIYSILQTPNIVKHFNNNLTGTTIKNLGLKTIRDTVISLPSLPEQTDIGSFFQDIDQLISLQQRKLEVLKEQKKTYLKLLFPAKEQKKPALRFAGFEDEWTSALLGDISELYQPKTISSEELLTEGFPVFGANGYIGYYKDYNHKEDQVTISARGEGTGTPSFVEGPVWITGNSMVVNVEKQANIIKPFLYAFCLSFNFKPFVTGGAQPQLTREVLKKVNIMLPSLPEQEAIGSFFQDLDKAIAKQEEKVNQLKESKQTLLRKMFI